MSDQLHISENISLKPYNTFDLEAKARYFFDAQNMDDLLWILHQPEFHHPKLVLGGGSNMLLTKDFDGLVVKISFTKKWIEKTEDSHSIVSVMAGENWHQFVLWTLENNLGGLENLSLIPGNVGTAPIQNIGAYGVEQKDCFHHLEALNVETGEFEIFVRKDCNFGYRHSYFKAEGKGKYIITRVFFELTNKDHRLHTEYGAIRTELERMGAEPSIHSISQAVINIRSSKLPDPAKIGNCGSFFKNPIVTKAKFEALQKDFPDIVSYPDSEGNMKLAAGWLIEKAGWKGFRRNDAGVHQKQALVLVNYGHASGKEIEALATEIQQSILRTFAVELEAEVNII